MQNLKIIRNTITGVFFVMTFLLTPKVFVDANSSEHISQIPVNMLQSPGNKECLWCQPELKPVDCDATTQPSEEKLLLNPDTPTTPTQRPCIQEKAKEDTTPSA